MPASGAVPSFFTVTQLKYAAIVFAVSGLMTVRSTTRSYAKTVSPWASQIFSITCGRSHTPPLAIVAIA